MFDKIVTHTDRVMFCCESSFETKSRMTYGIPSCCSILSNPAPFLYPKLEPLLLADMKYITHDAFRTPERTANITG